MVESKQNEGFRVFYTARWIILYVVSSYPPSMVNPIEKIISLIVLLAFLIVAPILFTALGTITDFLGWIINLNIPAALKLWAVNNTIEASLLGVTAVVGFFAIIRDRVQSFF
ncbi:MAG: hypothetical protein LUO93_06840 [Methanomicrobiales archaeon]|nr:hypothetical protein [Methanomicrobiales archaeon]